MQYSLPFAIENRLVSAHRVLMGAFGPIPPCHRLDPVGQMILAMLSGRTRDETAMPVFIRLLARLNGCWDELAVMPPEDIEPLIAGVTWSERKARHLPAALQTILTRRGRFDLDFLADWPVAEAKAWLEELPGVGAKTSAAVLNFSTLHRRILMVDTAHNRAAGRFGLVPRRASLDSATRLLNRQIPDDWTAGDTEAHHVHMQTLGKSLCVFARPHCPDCPLCRMCPSAGGPA